MNFAKTTSITERLNTVLANKDIQGLWHLLLTTSPSAFTLFDYYAFGRVNRIDSHLHADTWHDFEQALESLVRARSPLAYASYQIGDWETVVENGPLIPDPKHADYGTTKLMAEIHPDLDVRAAAARVAAHLLQQIGPKYGLSTDVIVKTTPTIDLMVQCANTVDIQGMDELVRDMWDNPNKYSNLEFMALGCIHAKYNREFFMIWPSAMIDLDQTLAERAPQKYHSFRMGYIRREIDEHHLRIVRQPNLLGHPQKPIDFVPGFLAESFGIANSHPDPDVQRMAKHVTDYLGALQIQNMNMAPQ